MRALTIATLLVFTACSRDAPNDAGVAAPSHDADGAYPNAAPAPIPVAIDATPVVTKTACERLDSASDRADLKFAEDSRMYGTCAAHEGGGWAEIARPAQKPGREFFVELVHLSDGGKIARAKFGQEGALTSKDVSLIDAQIPFRKLDYDFDDDGVPEVWMRIGADAYFNVEHDFLFTLRGGKIVSYPGASKLEQFELEDVDHDGVPDLKYQIRLEGGYDVCGAPRAAAFSPPLIGHATARGVFIFDDETAQKAARDACPSPPKSAAASDTSLDVLCARAWGAPVSDFLHFESDAKACDDAVEKGAREDSGDKRACEEREACVILRDRLYIAKRTPEIRLKASPSASNDLDAGARDAPR